MDSPTVEEIFASARRKQRILFVWMALGVVACFVAISSLQTIQTSINIEDNKGIATGSVGLPEVGYCTICNNNMASSLREEKVSIRLLMSRPIACCI